MTGGRSAQMFHRSKEKGAHGAEASGTRRSHEPHGATALRERLGARANWLASGDVQH